MSNLVFQANSGGSITLTGANTASTATITIPATTGNMVTTGDTGTVTVTMLSATGTPSSTTYLRGDGTWSTIAGQTYPGAGIANSTGSAWGTSYTTSGSGTVVALNNTPTLTTPVITGYTETAPSIANSSTAVTLSLASGTVLSYTLTGNCTFTMPTATSGTSFIVKLIQDGTGSRTATFTGVKWPGGTAPTITTTATTGTDVISFVCINSIWYGTFAQAFA